MGVTRGGPLCDQRQALRVTIKGQALRVTRGRWLGCDIPCRGRLGFSVLHAPISTFTSQY